MRKGELNATFKTSSSPFMYRVTPLVLEAFLVRLYREKNFVKAFTDQPEHITSGFSPIKNIMKELQLRAVHIYVRYYSCFLQFRILKPYSLISFRFHEEIKTSLERRRADVVELSQNLTERMADIHHAIIQCMSVTLSELKRSNATVSLFCYSVILIPEHLSLA